MPEAPVVGDGKENVRAIGFCLLGLFECSEFFEIGLGVSLAEFAKGGGGEVNLVPLVPEVVRRHEGGMFYLVGKVSVGRIHHFLGFVPRPFVKLSHLACDKGYFGYLQLLAKSSNQIVQFLLVYFGETLFGVRLSLMPEDAL